MPGLQVLHPRYQRLVDVLDNKACPGDFGAYGTSEAAILYEETYAERETAYQGKNSLTLHTPRILV